MTETIDTAPLQDAIAAFRTAFNARPSQSAINALNDLLADGRFCWTRNTPTGPVLEPTMELLDLVRRVQS